MHVSIYFLLNILYLKLKGTWKKEVQLFTIDMIDTYFSNQTTVWNKLPVVLLHSRLPFLIQIWSDLFRHL